MAEIYGEREGTRRMTNMVLQSQASWSAIERIYKGKRIVRKEAINLHGSPSPLRLAEACLRSSGRALPVANLKFEPHYLPIYSWWLDSIPPF